MVSQKDTIFFTPQKTTQKKKKRLYLDFFIIFALANNYKAYFMLYSFSNQKGGVGKSTLVLLFANYLSKRGENVLVLDADRQGSLGNQRKRDTETFSGQPFNYEVIQYSLDIPPQQIFQQVETLKEDNKENHIIFDLPGNLNENGIVPILTLSDIIFCPFQYERKSLDSTAIFVHVLQRLKETQNVNPQLVFIPNRVKTNAGTKEEKETFANIEKVLSEYGTVLPFVKELQLLTRVNSIGSSSEQEQAVSECFNQAIKLL